MHIGGRGSVEALATAVARAIAKVAEIRRSLARPPVGFLGLAIPEEGSITPESIKALGHGGGGNASELFSQALRRHAARRERSSQTSQRIVVDTYPFPSDPFYPIRKAFRGAWLVEDLPDPGLKKKWSVALTERGKFVIYSYERCCMDRGGNGIPPFPSRSVRRCVRTQAVRARSLCSGLFDRVGPP